MKNNACEKKIEEKKCGRPSKKDGGILTELFRKGKLGVFPDADRRLKAGIMFMRDYNRSFFTQRTTRNYDRLFLIDGAGKGDFSDSAHEAADRYLKALNAVGVYGVYAIHFLRDELNVSAFIAKYPVLNGGSKRTYRMVYLAINKMLDRLVGFYDAEKEKTKEN